MGARGSLFGANKVKEVPMVRDFERHHAWLNYSPGLGGFAEMKELAGQTKAVGSTSFKSV